MKALDIIKNLINVIGSSVGVVMIAIGSVMLLGAFLKLYVFDIKTSSHFQPYRCDQIIDGPMMHGDKLAEEGEEMSDQEREAHYQDCVTRETEREHENFLNQKKHAMIDGFALIVVGLPILVYYTRRARKDA